MALGLANQLGEISTEQQPRSLAEDLAGGFFVSVAVCCGAINEAILEILRHSGTVRGPPRVFVLLEGRATQQTCHVELDGFKFYGCKD